MSVESVLTQDPTGEELVTLAKQTADAAVRGGLKRAQIRRIFSEARLIDSMWDKDFQAAARRLTLLTPKIEYQIARDQSEGLRKLGAVLTEAIGLVSKAPTDDDRTKRFQRFMELFEAILAYHRAAGGN